jgi:hypothetical protein
MKLKIIALIILVAVNNLLFPCPTMRIHPDAGNAVN